MTTEEKFHAAVNVIRSLPKNGSYQPSNELMLRFYSYYKQATLGPCKGARPAIWNVVGRAKFDAWKTLGEMTSQAAMDSYVAELHRIVETMSYNDNVANFLEAQTDLEAVPLGDLELIAGDVIERVRSQPNSPFASREASPQRQRSSLETSPVSSPSISPPPGVNHVQDSDHSDEEYIDTVDSEPEYQLPSSTKRTLYNGYSNSVEPHIANGYGPRERLSRPKTKAGMTENSVRVDISQDVQLTVQNLKADLDRVTKKLNTLEKGVAGTSRSKVLSFRNVSPVFLAFIVLWPFVAHRLINFWSNRK